MSPRRRWCARVLGWVTIGLVPVIVTDEVPEGWGLVWLLACCAAALLQPRPAARPDHAPAGYTRMGTSA